jgi:hypothetical protein
MPAKKKTKIKKNHYAITVEKRWFCAYKGRKTGPLFLSEAKAAEAIKTLSNANVEALTVMSAWFVLEGGVPCIHEVIDGHVRYPVGFAGYQSEDEAKRVAKSYYETYAKNPHEYTVTKSLEI